MKTSTKLLISLFLSFVTAMFVAAISLRHQYDSFDKNDPYARWHGQAMPSFRAVQINGPSSALVQIEPGKTTRILTDTLNEWRKTAYTARVKHDTLFVQIKPTKGKLQRDAMTDDWRNPELIIQMPALMAVTTTNANCRIAAFTGDALTLQQLGKEGNLSLNKLQYKQLTASLSGNNRLKISELVNQIGQANITVRDSAQLDQLTDFANGFTLRADSTTMLRLTGKALRQMREK